MILQRTDKEWFENKVLSLKLATVHVVKSEASAFSLNFLPLPPFGLLYQHVILSS